MSRRTAEFASVILCVAMLLGIAIPMYQKIVNKASSVTAQHNLDIARKAVDQALMEASTSTGATYSGIDAAFLISVSPEIIWKDLPQGSQLQAYDKLDSLQKKSIFLVPAENGSELYLLAITVDRKIIYSRGVDGAWDNDVTVPYKEGLPGLVTVSQ